MAISWKSPHPQGQKMRSRFLLKTEVDQRSSKGLRSKEIISLDIQAATRAAGSESVGHFPRPEDSIVGGCSTEGTSSPHLLWPGSTTKTNANSPGLHKAHVIKLLLTALENIFLKFTGSQLQTLRPRIPTVVIQAH